MFILTDGKNYVMENPMRPGTHMSTTSPIQAKRMTYKEARALLNNKSKKLAWVKSFHMVNVENEHKASTSSNYNGNGGVYVGENDIEFNDDILNSIYNEANTIMNVNGWDINQLKTYEEELNRGLSKYDSVDSDLTHALQKYKEDNNGKRPGASKMAQIGYILDEVRDKRKHIKQCLNYIRVMEDALTYHYSMSEIKRKMNDATYVAYKGRTEYYQKFLDLLNKR